MDSLRKCDRTCDLFTSNHVAILKKEIQIEMYFSEYLLPEELKSHQKWDNVPLFIVFLRLS